VLTVGLYRADYSLTFVLHQANSTSCPSGVGIDETTYHHHLFENTGGHISK